MSQPIKPSKSSVDPGHGLGIAGFVLAFFGTQIIGLILSIVAYTKSKKAGYANHLALAGIWVNSAFIVIAIPVLIAITIVSYNGIAARADTSQAQNNALLTQKVAEAYYADTGAYPTSGDQLHSESTESLPSTIKVATSSSALNATNGSTTISYIPEDVNNDGTVDGGAIQFWDFRNNTVSSTVYYTGDATSLPQ